MPWSNSLNPAFLTVRKKVKKKVILEKWFPVQPYILHCTILYPGRICIIFENAPAAEKLFFHSIIYLRTWQKCKEISEHGPFTFRPNNRAFYLLKVLTTSAGPLVLTVQGRDVDRRRSGNV